ncbi:MAG: crossover junction endodeoxyribonuclease RuvC, partial [Parcubacteria group bacterium]
MQKQYKILGIDPGYGITGYGLIEKQGPRFICRDYGAITTSSKEDFCDRLKTLYQDLS